MKKTRFGFSLSRIYDYFKDKPFAIISAYLPDDPDSLARAEKLKETVRSMGYGYREIKGVWAPTKEDIPDVEYPLFIPNISLSDALYLASGAYFDGKPQYSILYSNGEDLVEIKPDGSILNTFRNFEANDLNKAWKFYSEYKGRKWRYSHWDMVEVPPAHPKGWAEHRAYYAVNEKQPHDFIWRKWNPLREHLLGKETPIIIAKQKKDIVRLAILKKDKKPEYIEMKHNRAPMVFSFVVKRDAAMRKWDPSRFTTNYKIPPKVAEYWDINQKNLLLSKGEYSNRPIERISWHPISGELILSESGSTHAVDIHNKGSHPFDEYIRAIVLPKQRKVVVRPWFPFSGTDQFRLEPGEAELLSFEAQDAFRKMLVKAGMPPSWSFEYNGSNARLQEITNRYQW